MHNKQVNWKWGFSILIVVMVLLSNMTHAADKPNVVLMLADNLGYGDLSIYNGGIRGKMITPNIDRLASEGLRFTQFLVEPGCTPSRAGLMTGRYSIRSGLSLVIAPGAGGGLQPEDITLGEIFKSAGYATTYIGKWHLGPQAHSQPQNQGFDQWRLGFWGSTDSTLYGEHMQDVGMPEAMQKELEGKIIEADGPGETKTVRAYNKEYRKQIEGDIARASAAYITQQAKNQEPFFLMIGWTRPHFPNDTSADFTGKSGVSKYGDSVLELDHQTGVVLKAIKSSGIEDKTIVIWISDNGPTVTATAIEEIHGGDAGPFRGELGDAYEGSIRTAGMIKWPGRIAPGVSNQMFSIHDFFPTLAKLIGGEVPNDRPMDGVDQSNFLLGKQEHSNRDHLLTFVGDRLVAVRWKQFRIYPLEFLASNTNPKVGGYMAAMRETAGFPQIFNIEADPKEKVNIAHTGAGWVMVPYLRLVGEYKRTLEKHPNRPATNVTRF